MKRTLTSILVISFLFWVLASSLIILFDFDPIGTIPWFLAVWLLFLLKEVLLILFIYPAKKASNADWVNGQLILWLFKIVAVLAILFSVALVKPANYKLLIVALAVNYALVVIIDAFLMKYLIVDEKDKRIQKSKH